MKKPIFIFLLALCLLFSACAEAPDTAASAEGVYVYRRLNGAQKTGGALLKTEQLPLDSGQDALAVVLHALSEAPDGPELENPLPADVEILQAEQSGSQIRLALSTAYLDMAELDKTLVKACLTLSLCALDGVDFVSLSVGGEILEPRLSTEDFLLFDSVISAEKAQTRVYFPKQGGRSLGAEYKTIPIGGENSVEREILDAIFRGPSHPELRRAFPEETLAHSVYTINGVCTVTLTGLDAKDPRMGPEDAELSVYSIVNSLFAVPGIKGVQILIDGQEGQELWGFSITATFTKNEEIIGSSPE